jgi:hypothetical protein
MRLKWAIFLWFLVTALIANAQQVPPPIIFFTDIIAGSASGNSDTTYGSTGGVYVTLYGNYLDNYTSVQLNGSSCLTVISGPATWLWYERMIVKLGTSCTSGNFSITTPGGTWSGPTVATTNAQTLMVAQPSLGVSVPWPTVDFTVSGGVIRYVGPSGNDNNAGSFSSPWATPSKAANTLGTTTGNVVYIMGGTYSAAETYCSGGDSVVCFKPDWAMGTSSQPNALVGYPGQTAQLGTDSGDVNRAALYSSD